MVSPCGFYFLIVPSRPEDLRRTVADRVAQRVAGRGISRTTVDAAVGSVLSAIEARAGGADGGGAARAGAVDAGQALVAAVTARSVPDLASRLRAALARDGVTVGSIGIAATGLHHVATLKIAGSGRAALERAVDALGGQLSIVNEDGGG